MADRGKVIASLDNALVQMHGCGRYTPEDVDELETAAWGALKLLEEQENCVSVPFTWLVKFCTHIDFHEPMSYEERAERWKEKLKQQFGVSVMTEKEREDMHKNWVAQMNALGFDESGNMKPMEEQEAVVRCKDCKYCEYPKSEKEWCKKGHLHGNAETWFCADGKRR